MNTPCQSSFLQRLEERIAKSRFFTFSLLVHIVIVVIGGGTVLLHPRPQPRDFTVPIELVKEDVLKAEQEPPKPTGPEQNPQPDPTPIAPTPAQRIITANLVTAQPTFQMFPGAAKISDSFRPGELAAGRVRTHTIPTAMAGRFGAAARNMAAKETGGTAKSEKAVMAGLRWLMNHQNPDGTWSDEFVPGMTGLAMLAFLGHGELAESPDFGPTVKRTIDWMLARGIESDGRMSLTKNGWGGNGGVYEHAILTYAMAEYYTITHDERFEPLLRKAVGYIVDGQNPVGGWDYHYAKGPRNDLSVAGWQIQALKAAHLTGLAIAGVDGALDKAMPFLSKWQGNEGGFGYVGPENRLSLTGVGVLCSCFWKESKDRTAREGIAYLLGKAEVKYKGDKADLYAWYYDTQACLMFGGPAWANWNRLFQEEIASNQSTDGSWPPTPGAHLQPKSTGAGPYYRTTICVLMLEAFYRYSPINK